MEILRCFCGWRGERFVVPQDAHLRDDESGANMGHQICCGLDLGHPALGREKQDEDQGFGGEHAEGGLLSVPGH